ncbi:MAG: homoserine dehydrogenase, partial [Vicinamibacterales bacterium]
MRERESVSSRCRVALLGFGTVGSAFARRLMSSEPAGLLNLQLTHIFDRRAGEKRASLAAGDVVWTSSIDEVLHSGVDVIVEAIGGLEPAAGWIRAALQAGKSVVTANKQVVARDGAHLLPLAARQGRQLRFEAAVGGAMPIVRAVSEGLAGDRITRLAAILNGTTNAVLSQMETTGCGIDEAVRDARERGYAEANVAADLDGHDACAKLAILCALAFGLRIDPSRIDVRSSASIGASDFARARRRGATIRQIAFA